MSLVSSQGVSEFAHIDIPTTPATAPATYFSSTVVGLSINTRVYLTSTSLMTDPHLSSVSIYSSLCWRLNNV